jgi:DNA-binding NarL/FixJ family response regulator
MQVLIVDSSRLIIERLRLMLSETENIISAYGAVSYKECICFLSEIKLDVVLIDSGLPGNECTALVTKVKDVNLNTRVIVLINGDDVHLQIKCKLLGADFFFDKYHEFEKIPGAINRIANDIKEEGINGK